MARRSATSLDDWNTGRIARSIRPGSKNAAMLTSCERRRKGRERRDAAHQGREAGDCDAVSSLLQQGADPTAESYTQWTPLHGAAEAGCVECIRLLLGAGAGSARAKSGLTPGIAKKYGRDAAFALLAQTLLDTYPVAVPETGGTIIITPCPGKRQRLGLDLDHLKASAPRRSSPWSRAASSTC